MKKFAFHKARHISQGQEFCFHRLDNLLL